MKIILALLLSVMILPAFAEPLSDRTGLKTNFPITVDSGTYTVEITANFDVRDVAFKENNLVFEINSSLNNNLGEIQIPNEITSGNLTFSLDGQAISPKILHNERISFVTLQFPGNGTHTLDITSDYVPKQSTITENTTTQTSTVDHSNDTLIIIAVVGIIIAGAAATSVAVYFKRKKA
ncbi:MAG: hypothetical protein EB153_01445 [Nitrosopumilaceae archaeon]|nr:hypothetical protein [Nitrosopumilaceae archaeon]